MVPVPQVQTSSQDGGGDSSLFRGKAQNTMADMAASVLQRRLNLRPDREEDHVTFQRNILLVEEFATLHPDVLRRTYKFDYYERQVYPLGMLCVFGADETIRDAVYNVHPMAAKHAFHMACGSAAPIQVVEWLYRKCTSSACRADPYGNGVLALHAACQESTQPQQRLEIVKFLHLHYPSALARTDIYGYTPIHYACQHAPLEIVQFLIQQQQQQQSCGNNNNNSIHEKEINAGYTAFELCLWRRTECIETVKYMIDEQFAHVKRRNSKTGRLALHLACKYSPTKVLEMVLEEYPQAAEFKDVDGNLPLVYATSNQELTDSDLALIVRANPNAIDAVTDIKLLQRLTKTFAQEAGRPRKKMKMTPIVAATTGVVNNNNNDDDSDGHHETIVLSPL